MVVNECLSPGLAACTAPFLTNLARKNTGHKERQKTKNFNENLLKVEQKVLKARPSIQKQVKSKNQKTSRNSATQGITKNWTKTIWSKNRGNSTEVIAQTSQQREGQGFIYTYTHTLRDG